MLNLVTMKERVDALVARHGSLHEVASLTGVDVGYLSRLRSGSKCAPSMAVLRRLGLRRAVTLYELEAACSSRQ